MLQWRVLLSYGFGHVLNDLCASMWFTYLIIFFHYTLSFSSALSGAALLIGQIADGIATPLVGILSDKGFDCWLCKYGHRKTWHLIGTICVAVSFPFIFSTCIDCNATDLTFLLSYYSVFIIVFQFGWAAVQISHLSLVPELSPDQHERTGLLTIRYTFTVTSSIIVHVLTWWVLRSHSMETPIGPQDKDKFRIVAIAVVCIGLVTSLLFHIGVKENRLMQVEKKSNGKISPGSLLINLRVYHIMCVYLMTQLFVNQSLVFIPLYLQAHLNIEAGRLALLPLVMYVGSFVTTTVIKPLNADYGRKIAYVSGGLLAIFGCTWVFIGGGEFYVKYSIYAVVVIFGCAGSIMLVTSLGITSDLIGSDTQNSAFIYGIMSFADKVSNGFVVMIIQSFEHYSEDNTYYRDMLIYVCGSSSVLGLLAVILLPKDNIQISISKAKDEPDTTTTTPYVSETNIDQNAEKTV